MSHTAYLENEVMSASPAKLVIMMYDGAINFLLNLEKLDWQKDVEKKGQLINKAIAIISELQATLKMDVKEVSEPLFALYSFMLKRLIDAHINNNPRFVEEVISLLRGLRDSWASIANPEPVVPQEAENEEYAREGFMIAC
jgi:flagellar protein FliS